MKNTFTRFIVSILAVTLGITQFGAIAYATSYQVCSSTAVQYFFINGVSVNADTSRGTAAANLQKFLVDNGVATNETVTPLRNPSDTLVVDVMLELTTQKLAENAANTAYTFANAIASAVAFISGNPSYTPTTAERSTFNSSVATFYNNAFGVANGLGTSNVTAGMTNAVLQSLNNGKKVVLVAHSQGNMFANAVWNAINGAQPANIKNGLKVVAVATPASSAQDGRYITSNTDLVINVAATAQAYILAAGIPLASNFSIPGALSVDATGHGFSEVYINRSLPGAAQVLFLISAAKAAAVAPSAVTTSGPIQATLTWDGVGDVDLHTIEPSNQHVYYSAMTGAFGNLDQDNVTSFGPEHYFTSCGAFAAGTWKFGVNYYAGSVIPQLAHLTVQTPAGSQTQDISLTQVHGSAGNNTPTLMFSVTSTNNNDGTYSFTTAVTP